MTPPKKNGISLNKEINVGHLLTMLTMIVLALSAWGSMKADINNKAHASEMRDMEINARVSQTSLILDNLIQRVEDYESRHNGE